MNNNYIRDPEEITRRSFNIIEREINLEILPKNMRPIASRMIHTCGITELHNYIDFSKNAVSSGQQALSEGATIIVDVNMVTAGIDLSALPKNNNILCTLNDDRTRKISTNTKITRAMAAVDLWQPFLKNSIVVIGNAPTALFRLLEIIDTPNNTPALVIATPPGFVGASESKEALINDNRGIPFIAVRGRLGGSAMAVAALNALARGI